jgi:hypothetical protein
MKNKFPELTFSYVSESRELSPNMSKMNMYSSKRRLLGLRQGMERECVQKNLNANGIVYDRYCTKQHHRTLLGLDNNSWLLWYGMVFTVFPKFFLPSVSLLFQDNLSVEIDPSFNVSLKGDYFLGRFDHFNSENVQPSKFRKFDTNSNGVHYIEVDFSYHFTTSSLYKRIKSSAFNIFWVIQTGTHIIQPVTLNYSYENDGYKKVLTNIDFSIENSRYTVFIPQRPRRSQFPGYERIPQESEIMIMKLIEGEGDVLWTVSGNEIKQYG